MKHAIAVLVLVMVTLIALAGCTQQPAAQDGDTVSVYYAGAFENATLFDTNDAAQAQRAGLYDATRLYQPSM